MTDPKLIKRLGTAGSGWNCDSEDLFNLCKEALEEIKRLNVLVEMNSRDPNICSVDKRGWYIVDERSDGCDYLYTDGEWRGSVEADHAESSVAFWSTKEAAQQFLINYLNKGEE